MSNLPISGLIEGTVVDINNDFLVYVDSSDTATQNILTGSTKKLKPANLPISTPMQTALDAKENTITAGTTAQYFRGDKTFQTLDKTAVGLSNVDNTSDLNKPVSTATQTALNAKQNTITTGTISQYFRGDLSLATLDKTAVGLSNVDNTSDANKPVSTATQTALDAKENTLNTDQKRKVTISTLAPTGGADGDVWLQYTP